MNLSFRVHSAGCGTAIVAVILITIGIVSPLAYSTWYLYGDGATFEHERRVNALIATHPIAAADRAAAAGEFVFIRVGWSCDTVTPGIPGAGSVVHYSDDPRVRFQTVRRFREDELDPRRRRLQAAVLRWIEVYNRRLLERLRAS